ncbi:MAG TPA: NADH-quinone oxidoreductase subunit C [Gammaproteobacteria bacterium]|nr:NADH-quinone oxidoreductase subunit C [Gammaproteobacteria bacterium]|tara:strand:+ start:1633 stop:2328 length:696 start_codon:yes stop_codon:yes gene_type:complete
MKGQKVENIAAIISERFGDAIISQAVDRGELTVVVRAKDVVAVGVRLRDDEQLLFSQLSDLSGIDYLSYGHADWQTHSATDSGFSRGVRRTEPTLSKDIPARFAVVYQLLSMRHNFRLRLKAFLDDDAPRIDSVVDVWPSADWYEREAFDLFGILFNSHPDLRRILTDYGFIGHPFRKDFPLEGHVEVRYDLDKNRVIYQPVSIEKRVLVPKVTREDVRVVKTVEGAEPDA